jgi:hypothetical protein
MKEYVSYVLVVALSITGLKKAASSSNDTISCEDTTCLFYIYKKKIICEAIINIFKNKI